ncbi:BQ5605_C020g09070 [Microbotryum silenes-dioicae]|uniref:BQ5605_C020g09070 protein n=1 Tax=Microbotryum silenes-dioicae TaxID=796604 RepID=A0A2X0PDK7_9BASI|nr:BQ5605_C020g09070 [Microbotryum silenes-dioicae]
MLDETDLQQLLSGIEPLLDDVIYTFGTIPLDSPIPPGCIGTFDEREGRTLILPLEIAKTPPALTDVKWAGEWAEITLQIHSSLEAVGFIAAIATTLGIEGISANVMSGFYHDHVFVQWGRRDDAITVIRGFAKKE